MRPSLLNLKQLLTRPSRLPDGFLRVKIPTERFDLRQIVVEHLVAGGFTDRPVPLGTLHERIPMDYQLAARPQPGGDCAIARVKTSAQFRSGYHRLVQYIAEEVLGYDVLIEDTPNLRLHFPVPLSDRFRAKDGQVLAYHVDQFFADPFEQINCWLPLNSCFGQNTMHWSSLSDGIDILSEFSADFDYDEQVFVTTGRRRFFDKMNTDDAFRWRVVNACKPLVADYGEIILFDGRIVHGTMENTDHHTRVSFDFRILPLDDYNSIEQQYRDAGLPLPIEGTEDVPVGRGGFYYSKTALELGQSAP